MYESVLYQTIEYVIAPIGLMIFLYYVKNINTREKTFTPEFKENGIESLFIAAYSHVLYYFSVTAHANGNHNDKIIEITKSASLMSAVLGLMLIFILKYYSDIWGIKHWKSKLSTNTTALLLMLFLFFIICFMNFRGWHINFASLATEQFIFITYPNNLLFIFTAIAILIIQYKLNSQDKQLTKGVKTFLELNTIKDDININDRLRHYTNIAKSNVNPNFIRVDAFIASAKLLQAKADSSSLTLALEEIEKAKRLALESDYPESLLYGIRKLKIQIHGQLKDKESASLEISEIEKQNQAESIAELAEMRNDWIKILKAMVDKMKI